MGWYNSRRYGALPIAIYFFLRGLASGARGRAARCCALLLRAGRFGVAGCADTSYGDGRLHGALQYALLQESLPPAWLDHAQYDRFDDSLQSMQRVADRSFFLPIGLFVVAANCPANHSQGDSPSSAG